MRYVLRRDPRHLPEGRDGSTTNQPMIILASAYKELEDLLARGGLDHLHEGGAGSTTNQPMIILASRYKGLEDLPCMMRRGLDHLH